MLSVKTNRISMVATLHQRDATQKLTDSFRKLSSGLRIERAADDAAGLAVSENLDARSMSQRVAIRNANDGISVIQTMEGGVKEVGDILKRMRELAVQSSSETLASTERAYLNDEFTELQSEIGRIRETTAFNGLNLLNGTWAGGKDVQVGANDSADDRIAIVMGDVSQTDSAVATASLTTSRVAQGGGSVILGKFYLGPVGSVAGSTAEMFDRWNVPDETISSGFAKSNSAIARANAINATTSKHGVTATVGKSTYSSSVNIVGGTMNASERIWFAGGNAAGSKNISLHKFVVQANDSDGALQKHMQSQLDGHYGTGIYTVDTSSGALEVEASDGRSFRFNSTDAGGVLGFTAGTQQLGTAALTLSSASDFEYQATNPSDWGVSGGTNVVAASGGSASIDLSSAAAINISTVAGAQTALSNLDKGLDTINGHRSKLGAVQNRLESAINNLNTDTESLLAARSRIRDADFAFETAQLSKAQIMQNASTSVLAQGNQLPQMALRLIG